MQSTKPIKLIPDRTNGFFESMKEIAKLSRENVNVAYALGKFVKSGAEFCTADIDWSLAEITGEVKIFYKLHDDLLILLSTFGTMESTTMTPDTALLKRIQDLEEENQRLTSALDQERKNKDACLKASQEKVREALKRFYLLIEEK